MSSTARQPREDLKWQFWAVSLTAAVAHHSGSVCKSLCLCVTGLTVMQVPVRGVCSRVQRERKTSPARSVYGNKRRLETIAHREHHQVLTNAWKSMDEVALALQFMLRAGAIREEGKNVLSVSWLQVWRRQFFFDTCPVWKGEVANTKVR